MPTNQVFDVAVVGAGVFGAWSAHQLKRAGAEVVLLDAYGPANSRSSSGGESRMIRMGYGPDEIYTRMAQRSLTLWQELFDRNKTPNLFQPTGILWLAHESDPYCEATLETLQRCQIRCEPSIALNSIIVIHNSNWVLFTGEFLSQTAAC